jgi:zinc/manganese transport system ATP-binding protein
VSAATRGRGGEGAADLEAPPVLQLIGATLRFGHRTLWSGLDLSLTAGEFVAVLGSNGTGKTSLFRAVLGQQRLSEGSVRLLGEHVHRGDRRIGYVPQRLDAPDSSPVRGQDLVALGHSGHRFGPPWPSRRRAAAVREALEAVGGTALARRPLGRLSGGEQQRLRIAQALVDRPRLLLCDEPFAALDLSRQRVVSDLIDTGRRRTGCGVLVITHDINPVLAAVDRVVYLANGQARVGSVDEVFTSAGLSAMYETPVEVIRTRGRIVVVGATGQADTDPALAGTASH